MKPHRIILIITALALVIAGIILFVIPPAVFPDPGQGFQVLRSMQMGSGFNNFISPDQSDISQNYTEFLTWWSPGQYLVPYLFTLVTGFGLGKAIALTVLLFEIAGLAGFYTFFKKVGFTPGVAAISIVFIASQIAFVVPFVFYNGGELLLFGFEGWFLYGCVAFKRPGVGVILFVLLSGLAGFFCKSSFLWMYVAGLFCLWIRLADTKAGIGERVKKALWVGVPAAISLAIIYTTFISKGRSPASAAHGVHLTAATFSFPAAAPILSGFSLDDFFHGLFFHFGKPFFSPGWSIVIILVLALLSLCLLVCIIRHVHDRDYKLFLAVFYAVAILFFGFSYLFQLNISMEARHLRIIGLITAPGLIFLLTKVNPVYRVAFAVVFVWIAYSSVNYLVKGFKYNNENARGITGIAQPNVDQQSLNAILKIDKENTNATFVFISNDIGLEILHNRIITLSPIADDLKINVDDYRYDGFAGPLYIVLPESYNGPREKMIMKSFPGYAGWNVSMLSNNYVLYAAKMKR